MKSISHRIAASVALLAALLGAFAATVTHVAALVHAARDPAQAVVVSCPMRAAPPPAETPSQRDTCPFCVDPGVVHAPPPALVVPAVLSVARYPVPAIGPAFLAEDTVWLAPLSRGPPALS